MVDQNTVLYSHQYELNYLLLLESEGFGNELIGQIGAVQKVFIIVDVVFWWQELFHFVN